MNILHLALNDPTNPQSALELALRSLGDNYEQIDWKRHSDPNALTDLIIERSKAIDTDLIFMQFQNPGVVIPDKLQKAKGFKLNWSGDVRHPTPPWYYELGKKINLTCFTNLEDVDNLRAAGIPADYLQIGYEEKVYTPEGPTGNFAEICFLGSNYLDSGYNFPLSPEREAMVDFLTKRYGPKFAVYGKNWPQSGNKWIGCKDGEEQKAYHSCKIAINHNHYCYRRYTSDRTLRIMACGAFCLNRWYPGVEEEFFDGVHLVSWGLPGSSGFKQLQDHIDYYLEHEDERKEIAEQGCEHVRENHTWAARMEDLKELINEYEGGKKNLVPKTTTPEDGTKITDTTYFEKKIRNKEPFVFIKFGDADLFCMQGRNMVCDGQSLSAKLAKLTIQCFAKVLKQKNVYMGDWVDDVQRTPQLQKIYLLRFGITPNFTDFDLLLSVETNMQNNKLFNFYKAIKESDSNKIFIGPRRLHGVINMLNIDEYIAVPLKNSFGKYEKIKSKLLKTVGKKNILILACGRTAKPLCKDVLASNPDITIIDAGSAFDPIFIGPTREKQCSIKQCEKYYKRIL